MKKGEHKSKIKPLRGPDMPNIEQASTSQGLNPNCKRSVSSYHRCVTGLDSRVLKDMPRLQEVSRQTECLKRAKKK